MFAHRLVFPGEKLIPQVKRYVDKCLLHNNLNDNKWYMMLCSVVHSETDLYYYEQSVHLPVCCTRTFPKLIDMEILCW